MVTLERRGVFLINGRDLVVDDQEASRVLQQRLGRVPDREEAGRETISYRILAGHNTSGNMEKLRIRFDKLTSHDITFVGIIQTARASGLEKFPMPYVLTNCHNSLCAVGGTINEDDHMFGLSCAKHYGGVYVPPHQAVIHQFAREMLATGGGMILGSDSHTRYGALGTMAVGEGGPELVKQLLGQTYDINRPQTVAVYLNGEVRPGVGPQDVALAIIGAVFESGFVNNKVLEFVGPGVEKLTADFRIGVDVMTTETTCLSSIWETDEEIRSFYALHGREEDYRELHPGSVAYYESCVKVDLGSVEPMIAMPFHPSNTYTIHTLQENLEDILHDVEQKAKVSFGENTAFSLRDKIRGGRLYVYQGFIAGCAGCGYENICDAADILKGKYIGNDTFTLSVYPASTPIYRQLAVNGVLADLIESGAVVKTAFCGPCFGAGDTPANNGFSIRHSTRNFPNREGSKIQNGQIASVALMDARSIAATAAAGGYLTAATDVDVSFTRPAYYFDSRIYANRVYDSKGVAHPEEPVIMGPNIKDWPVMQPLPDHLLLQVVSEIHDPVTTTDELIPSGETSSYRSNPLGLAKFTLSRKDPAYVGAAKKIQLAQKALERGEDPAAAMDLAAGMSVSAGSAAGNTQEGTSEDSVNEAGAGISLGAVLSSIREKYPEADNSHLGIGSTIFAVKPGDGSAREQAASCQKVLGGWANIAHSYATKRYRSNLINWGMLPLLIGEGDLPFTRGDYIFLPGIRGEVENKAGKITAWVVRDGAMMPFMMTMGELTDDERQIILDGCLINYNKVK